MKALTLQEAYDVLTSDTDPWPNEFQPKKKIKFIQQLMDYFQQREEYERCAKLLKLQKEVTKYGKYVTFYKTFTWNMWLLSKNYYDYVVEWNRPCGCLGLLLEWIKRQIQKMRRMKCLN